MPYCGCGAEASVCPPAWPYPASLVVYGMDRSRTTPLTTFCPIDILRNTLGCRALPVHPADGRIGLGDEPHARQRDDRRREAVQAEKGKEGCRRNPALYWSRWSDTWARPGPNPAVRPARDIEALAEAEGPSGEAIIRLADKLGQIVADPGTRKIEPLVPGCAGKPGPGDSLPRLAEQIGFLAGKAGAMAECERIGAELRDIGAVQDRTLSNCPHDGAMDQTVGHHAWRRRLPPRQRPGRERSRPGWNKS